MAFESFSRLVSRLKKGDQTLVKGDVAKVQEIEEPKPTLDFIGAQAEAEDPSKIIFHDIPAGIADIDVPRKSLWEEMTEGWIYDLSALIANSPIIGRELRVIAERAWFHSKTMQVVELRNGAPFDSLFFQGPLLRVFGDFMIYNTFRHEKPDVISTVVATEDVVIRFLNEEWHFDNITEENRFIKMLQLLATMTATNIEQFKTNSEKQRGILHAYSELVRQGKIIPTIQNDPVEALISSYTEGKRYDLIFPDLNMSLNRMTYLQAVQANLTPGGSAYIPIEWYRLVPVMRTRARVYGGLSSDDYKLGFKPDDLIQADTTSRYRLIGDTVQEGGRKTSLEMWLKRHYPDYFDVYSGGGSTIFVVRGTDADKPLQLPEFEAILDENIDPDVESIPIVWTPKTTTQE